MICYSCFDLDPECCACHPCPDPFEELRSEKDLSLFGTEAYPLHASRLQKLVTCPWRYVMEYLFGATDESGPAADTGSAFHVAVAAWHENGKDPAAAVKAMVERHGEFPLADLDEAAALFLLYCRDPRNQEAEVVAVERKVRFELPPAPEDPTGAPILVLGTCDQLRRENGRLCVYDLKTSKRSGFELLQAHQYQVAGYCLGAARLFGEPVHPGQLICPRHYPRSIPPEQRPPGVFFPFSWAFHDAALILWGVRRIVAAIRSGEVWHNGGEHCRYCPAGSPDVCVPMLRKATDPRTNLVHLPVVPAPVDVEEVDEVIDVPEF